jgi:hypothetical protein
MEQGRSKLCSTIKVIDDLEKLAEQKDKSKFHEELHNTLRPFDMNYSLFFLWRLQDCFDAQKRLHPNLELPDIDVPREQAIV